jgi:hypothetical protein
MEYDPKDNEVIHLLKKLKDSNGAYPPEMLALRRQGYLKQVTQVSAGAGLAVALRSIAKGGKGAAGASSSTAGTVVEALLVVALIAEAGAVSYFYRGKVAEYFRSITRSPNTGEVASPPMVSSPLAEMQITPSPVITITVTGTQTLTLTPVTPSGTPSTVLVAETVPSDGETGVDVQSSASTSIPGSTGSTSSTDSNTGGSSSVSTRDPNGNNGNHYGQTPIPVRTKDPGNTSSSTQTTSNKKKP